jgi:hypothetical protein
VSPLWAASDDPEITDAALLFTGYKGCSVTDFYANVWAVHIVAGSFSLGSP